MLYIITEDSISGKRFFELLVKCYYANKNVSVIGCTGNRTIKSKIESLITNNTIKAGDKVFIAYDNVVSDSSNIGIINRLVTDINAICMLLNSKNIKYDKSQYTCIEELFLSFDKLLDICQTRNSKDKGKQIYLDIYNKLTVTNRDVNYNKVFEYMMYNTDGVRINTLENCMSSLLGIISYNFDFDYFRIFNKRLFTCWEYDCDEKAYRKMQEKEKTRYIDKHANCGCIKLGDIDSITKLSKKSDINKCMYRNDLRQAVDNSNMNSYIVEFERNKKYCDKCLAVKFNTGNNMRKALNRFKFVVENSTMKDVKLQIDKLLNT